MEVEDSGKVLTDTDVFNGSGDYAVCDTREHARDEQLATGKRSSSRPSPSIASVLRGKETF